MSASVDELGAGYESFRAGDLDRAEEAARQSLGEGRREAEGWCLLGLVAQARGKPAEAVSHFREAVRVDPDCAEAHNNLGRAYLDQGQPNRASPSLQQALRLRPSDPEAHRNLGDAYRALGRQDEAMAEYREAVRLRPDFPEALNTLALMFLWRGEAGEAAPLLERAVRARPGYAEAHDNLAWASNDLGRHEQALACAAEAVRLDPDRADSHNNHGLALLGLGRLAEAVTSFDRAARLNPDLSHVHCNLGVTLIRLGRYDEAVACLDRAATFHPHNAAIPSNKAWALGQKGDWEGTVRAVRWALWLDPKLPEAYNNLGLALMRLNQPHEAGAVFQEAVRLRPDFPEAHSNLGWSLIDQGRGAEAVTALTEAVRLRPDFAAAYANLGLAYLILGKPEESRENYEHAVRLNPNDAGSFGGLGSVLKDLGRLDEALACYRKCLALNPHDTVAHSNLLLSLHYQPGLDPEEVFQEHRRWAAQHLAHVPPPRPHPNDRDPGRRLRIGYVSADFRWHVMGFYIEPVLAARDRSRFEVFCYSNSDRADATTARIRKLADHWRDILGRSDEQVAEMVREDRIDLLVDLNGHTGGNRLALFGYKPAPVQAAHFGYVETTGLDAIDYYITDAVCDPPGKSERYHTERLARLPEILWHHVPNTDLDPGPLPASAAGHVTFGVMGAFPKITPQAVAAWSQILHAVPGSRLSLLAGISPQADERLLAAFARHGIGPDRLTLLARQSRENYLRLYQGLDVYLDTFPYTGCNTTCDALWMGVPVVCLAGVHGIARQGASPLVHLGLNDLVVESPEAYVEAAVRLARDLPRLAELRAGLRERMSRATLTNPERFTRQLEDLYRSMWRDYCARGPAPGANGDTASPAEALASTRRSLQRGDLAEAERHYRRLLAVDPANADAPYEMGLAYYQAGRPAEAADCFRRLVEARPDHGEAWTSLGVALLAQGKVDEAVDCQRRALGLRPDLAEVHTNLGEALFRQGKREEAVDCFERAVYFQPGDPAIHFRLGTALAACGWDEDAAASFREAVRLRPGYAEAHLGLGAALASAGDGEGAVACYRRALSLRPNDAAAHHDLAAALLERGEREEAVAHFREALRLNPNSAGALARLALHDLHPLTEAEVGRMKALLARPGLPPGDACLLHFGLANLRDRAGAPDEAFEHFRQGNALRRRLFHQAGTGFDPHAHRARLDRLIRTFDADYFRCVQGFGVDSEAPVFVVGMPGSGAWLVERILSRHPQAHGAGELGHLDRLVDALADELGGAAGDGPAPGSDADFGFLLPGAAARAEDYPDCLAGAPREAVRALAERCLGRLTGLVRGARRVVDRTPTNYLHLGLIATLFPRARVIHCRRDPLDTCASCYLSYFRDMPFAWDLEDLGAYYREYERLMAHWRSALPLSVLEVSYEELVSDPGAVSRRLVGFCGLDWDGRCLAHPEGPHPADAVSPLEARRPAGAGSVGRWRRYAAHLQPLRDALPGRDRDTAVREALAQAVRHYQAGAWPQAEQVCREVLRANPREPEALHLLGVVHYSSGRPDQAVAHIREALALRPGSAAFHCNLGLAYQDLGRLDEAVACLRRSLDLEPDSPAALNNLGNALRELGRLDEALACYERTVAVRPDHPEAHLNRARVWLLMGDHERGWPELEWRWKQKGTVPPPFAQPVWDGTPLAGRTILLHAEGGLGDTVQFVRYAALVKQRGGTVVLECQPALVPLLAGSPGLDRLVGKGAELPPFDVHASLLSLPAILGTTAATVPRDVPYVFPDPGVVAYWRRKLGGLPGFKVGIAWQGNPQHEKDLQRSVLLTQFAALARCEGVQLISLQKGPGSEQLQALGGRFPVLDLGDDLDAGGAFVDTAAVMKNLDLVVTSDTAIPHLAGALGVPVWLALRSLPEWRWLLGRDDSPWYPTMRLFRQQAPGDWAGVFERMADALRQLRREGAATSATCLSP